MDNEERAKEINAWVLLIISAVLGIIAGYLLPFFLIDLPDTTANDVYVWIFMACAGITIGINSIIRQVGYQAYVKMSHRNGYEKSRSEMALEAGFYPTIISVIGLIISMEISIRNWEFVGDAWVGIAIVGIGLGGMICAVIVLGIIYCIADAINVKQIADWLATSIWKHQINPTLRQAAKYLDKFLIKGH